jgi:hypothetical protein
MALRQERLGDDSTAASLITCKLETAEVEDAARVDTIELCPFSVVIWGVGPNDKQDLGAFREREERGMPNPWIDVHSRRTVEDERLDGCWVWKDAIGWI